MGAAQPSHSTNDYELVIRSSKDLEYFLEVEFGATGKGLHEKISSIQHSQLPDALVRKMRFLATIRNKLIHQRGFDEIPDRDGFIRSFEQSKLELATIIKERSNNNNNNTCLIS